MYTISETRRLRVEMLVKRFKSAAELNSALGWSRTDPKISQIRNANNRPDRQKPYQMGDAMAREFESRLDLERGWMDTPPAPGETAQGDQSSLRMVKAALPDLDLALAALLAAVGRAGAETQERASFLLSKIPSDPTGPWAEWLLALISTPQAQRSIKNDILPIITALPRDEKLTNGNQKATFNQVRAPNFAVFSAQSTNKMYDSPLPKQAKKPGNS